MAVEKTVRYVTTVDSVTEAFAFVMEYLDQVGASPSIEIRPIWESDVREVFSEDPAIRTRFEVVVDGMEEQ